MKSRILTLLCMALCWVTMQSQTTLTLSGGEGHPGDEVTVSVSMSGTEPVTALELQIPLPAEAMAYVDGSAALNPARGANHTLSAAMVEGNLRLYIYSLSLAPIKGSEGELLSFRLRLLSEPGNYTLSVVSAIASTTAGGEVPTSSQSGSVTLLAPKLEIATPRIDFGHVPINSSYTQSVALLNSGTEELTVERLTSHNYELPSVEGPWVIAAGSSVNIPVAYNPINRYPFTAALAVESDAANGKPYNRWQEVEVVADPYSVNELHLQQCSGYSDQEVTVELTMNNMEPIVGAQVEIQLPDGIEYVDGSAQLSSRGSAHQVTATVVNGGLRLYAYNLANTPFEGNDGTLLTFKVKLGLSSGWHWLNIVDAVLPNRALENMTSAVSGAYIEVKSPAISGNDALDFGNQPITAPLTASYSIQNHGNAPLIVDRVTFLAEGFECSTSLPLTIQPWEAATLAVSCNRADQGNFATTMNIYSNDPNNRMKAVKLSGSAFLPNDIWLEGDFDAAEKQCVINVNLTNHSDISALQFDIALSNPSNLSGEPIISSTDRSAGHSVMLTKQGKRLWRVVAFSMTNASFAGNDGAVASIKFPLSELPSEPLTFSLSGNGVISDKSGRDVKSPHTDLPSSVTINFPTSIKFDKDRYSLKPGLSVGVVVTVEPEDAFCKEYELTIEDETIATITPQGELTGVAEGKTVIIARTANGCEGAAEVYVSNVLIPVENISLDCNSMTLIPGGSRKLTATVSPADADDTSVVWSSENSEIASVDNNGNVSAIALGTTTIVATASNGMTAECQVTVTDVIFPVTLNGITYDLQDDHLWITGTEGELSPELRLESELGGNRLYGIRSNVFSGRYDIFHCVIPEGVEVIEPCAFNYSMLNMVVLPSTLHSLGRSAFNGVDLSVVINKAPQSLSLINADIAVQSNRIVYVPDATYREYTGTISDSPVYPRLNELFECNGLWFVPVDDETVHLISSRADIPEGRVVIPATVAHNGKQMNVTRINRFAFDGISRAYGYRVDFVTSVEIPRMVSEIAPEAFSSLNLREVSIEYLDPEEVNADPNAFSDIDYDKCMLMLPHDASSRFSEVQPWCNFIQSSGVRQSAVDHNAEVEVYTLNGVRIYKGAPEGLNLPSGVYIVNGKKILNP